VYRYFSVSGARLKVFLKRPPKKLKKGKRRRAITQSSSVRKMTKWRSLPPNIGTEPESVEMGVLQGRLLKEPQLMKRPMRGRTLQGRERAIRVVTERSPPMSNRHGMQLNEGNG
jgi:hypothetical protein